MFKYIIFLLATQIGAAGFTFPDGSPVELSADGHLIWSRGQEIAINNWSVPWITLTNSTGATFTCCLDKYGRPDEDLTLDPTSPQATLVISSNGQAVKQTWEQEGSEDTGGGWTKSEVMLGTFPSGSLTIVSYKQTYDAIINEIRTAIRERKQHLQQKSRSTLAKWDQEPPKSSSIKFTGVDVRHYTPDPSEHVPRDRSKPTQADSSKTGASRKERSSKMVGRLEDWEGAYRAGLSHLHSYSQLSYEQKWESLYNTIEVRAIWEPNVNTTIAESSGTDVTVVTSKSESGPAIYQPGAVQQGATIASFGMPSSTESASALVPMEPAVPASPDIPAVTQAPAEDLGAHVQIVMEETDTSDKSQPGAESKNSVFGCCFGFC